MAFEALKERQSMVWGNGNFEHVAETIGDIHDVVVEALAPVAGELWLDLACGTGGVSERAARAGASVVGLDFAPPLVEIAKRRAAELRLEIDYRVGDCEDLSELEAASFDVASSTFGIMFCPDHVAAARELARVVRPRGRIGLANWTPDGAIGQMFQMLAPFQPPPPPEADAPLDWGRPEYVEEMLGDAFELEIEERISTLTMGSGEEYWQLFVANFGPVKTLAESLDDGRREELHRAWVDFYESGHDGDGPLEHTREYLLVIGTRK
jgi:ubiquinone/menaquinone biosynthesis C-methylase UbiE